MTTCTVMIMSGMFDAVAQVLSSLEASTLVWIAALLSAICAALFLWATQAQRARRKQARQQAWQARSHLRIRGT